MAASILFVVGLLFVGIQGDAANNVSQHKNIKLINSDVCGLSSKPPSVGKLFQTPWMSLLVYNTSRGVIYSCGGSVISDRYILTAAHCVKNLPKYTKLIGVRLGEYDYNQPIDCEELEGKTSCAKPSEQFGIEKITPHQEYSQKTFRHNIALLRLNRTANFSSDSVRPICLPVLNEEREGWLHDGQLMTVVGWGTTSTGVQSSVVRTVHVEHVPRDVCAAEYGNFTTRVEIFEDQICLRGTAKGDATSGDGGGPVVSGGFELLDKVFQYGIVSFGPSSAVLSPPGVYTHVGSYMGWILDNMKINDKTVS